MVFPFPGFLDPGRFLPWTPFWYLLMFLREVFGARPSGLCSESLSALLSCAVRFADRFGLATRGLRPIDRCR